VIKKLMAAQLVKKFAVFKEPWGSQDPTTRPYPEPNEPS